MNTQTKIYGHQGWYDLVYIELKATVEGYIKAGIPVHRSLELAFDSSCASKGIKHRIENEIKLAN